MSSVTNSTGGILARNFSTDWFLSLSGIQLILDRKFIIGRFADNHFELF
jgi:hypothetical protein